jgi:hypothetical protein
MKTILPWGAAALLAFALVPSVAVAEQTVSKVKKVDDFRYKCTYSDGSFTHTTAKNKAEARKNCEAAANGRQVADVIEQDVVRDQVQQDKSAGGGGGGGGSTGKAVAPPPKTSGEQQQPQQEPDDASKGASTDD